MTRKKIRAPLKASWPSYFDDHVKLRKEIVRLDPEFQRITGCYDDPEGALALLQDYAARDYTARKTRKYSSRIYWEEFVKDELQMRQKREANGTGHSLAILQNSLETALGSSTAMGRPSERAPNLEEIEMERDPGIPHVYARFNRPRCDRPLDSVMGDAAYNSRMKKAK